MRPTAAGANANKGAEKTAAPTDEQRARRLERLGKDSEPRESIGRATALDLEGHQGKTLFPCIARFGPAAAALPTEVANLPTQPFEPRPAL